MADGASATPTAQRYLEALRHHSSPVELDKIQRYFKSGEGQYGEGDVFIGVRMGQVFVLAEEFKALPLDQSRSCWRAPSTRRAPAR